MGNLVNLSSAIAAVLGELKDTDASALFKDIQEVPTLEFSGYPAVTVAPSDVESDYATVVQNMRTYAFAVDIYYPIADPNSVAGYAEGFAAMRGLMDNVVDAFDNSDDLHNACQILRPAPSSWQVVETAASVMVSARVHLKCLITTPTNNG